MADGQVCVVRVCITRDDGEVLDQYEVRADYSALHPAKDKQENLLSNAIREVLEENFDEVSE